LFIKGLLDARCLDNTDFEGVLAVLILVEEGGFVVLWQIQTLVLRWIFVPRRRPSSVAADRVVLFNELRCRLLPLIEEIDPRSEAPSIVPLAFPLVINLDVIQVLSFVGLLLPARRSLPMLELLESKPIGLLVRNRLCLPNQVLQFVLNFGLLLLEILRLKDVQPTTLRRHGLVDLLYIDLLLSVRTHRTWPKL
jgi:hypothetical protein